MPKYDPDTSHWDEDDDPPQVDEDAPVSVGHHSLEVRDERDSIERYNGFTWSAVIEDGQIVAVDQQHYCPGPGHTDPMGFSRWDEVPQLVRKQFLASLNGTEDEVVNVERVNEAGEDDWP